MRILLLIFVSFFAFTDDHDEMYQEGWAEYVYCSVKDGLSDQKAEQMFERRMKAYAEMAESLDDEVTWLCYGHSIQMKKCEVEMICFL